MIHPKTINGERIMIFIHDIEGNCGGSAMLYGIARFEAEEFYVERTEKPHKFPIPESAWQSLKKKQNIDTGEFDQETPYVVRLIIGNKPEDEVVDDYQEIDIPILKSDK